MPVPASTISVICNSVIDFIKGAINSQVNLIDVTLGPPGLVDDDELDRNALNLFFYRFEPYGFDSRSYPDEPWRLRMFCLVTAFGVEEETVSIGENELRLLGGVMQYFHEKPVMDTETVSGEDVRLQVVFSPLTDEQINQVWSTQGDTTYHPSVIYEMAVVPIVPTDLRPKPSLVGAIGSEARAGMEYRYEPFSGSISATVSPIRHVNINNPLWAPSICWVYANTCLQSLSFEFESPEYLAFTPQVWLAGDPGELVTFNWQQWESTGLQPVGSTSTATPYSPEIEPDNLPAPIPGIFPEELAIPVFAFPETDSSTQLLLHASREVISTSGEPETVKSNPLLITIYRSS